MAWCLVRYRAASSAQAAADALTADGGGTLAGVSLSADTRGFSVGSDVITLHPDALISEGHDLAAAVTGHIETHIAADLDDLDGFSGQLGAAAGVYASAWTLAFDHDFTAEATLDYDHTAGTISLLAATWTQEGTTFVDDLDLTNGTGLVADMSTLSSVFNTFSGVDHYQLSIDLDDPILFGAGYDIDQMIVIDAMLGGLGDENTEIHGVGIWNAGGGTHHGAALGLGTASGVASVRAYRQQSSLATSGTEASGAADCVRIVRKNGSWTCYYGTSSGGEFPSTWTRSIEFSANVAANQTAPWGSGDKLLLWAQTGNTDGDFAPIWKRIRGHVLNVELP